VASQWKIAILPGATGIISYPIGQFVSPSTDAQNKVNCDIRIVLDQKSLAKGMANDTEQYAAAGPHHIDEDQGG
jgi:hypothetical protein